MDSDALPIPAINASQVRAARALLGWSREDAAARCGVSTASLSRYERQDGILADRTVRDIVAGFEKHGIDFFADGRRAGVALTIG